MLLGYEAAFSFSIFSPKSIWEPSQWKVQVYKSETRPTYHICWDYSYLVFTLSSITVLPDDFFEGEWAIIIKVRIGRGGFIFFLISHFSLATFCSLQYALQDIHWSGETESNMNGVKVLLPNFWVGGGGESSTVALGKRLIFVMFTMIWERKQQR